MNKLFSFLLLGLTALPHQSYGLTASSNFTSGGACFSCHGNDTTSSVNGIYCTASGYTGCTTSFRTLEDSLTGLTSLQTRMRAVLSSDGRVMSDGTVNAASAADLQYIVLWKYGELTGTGLTTPTATSGDYTKQSYGSLDFGSATATKSVTINNFSGRLLTPTFQANPGTSSYFTYSASSCNSISIGGNCTFNILYTAPAPAASPTTPSGSIEVNIDDVTHTIALTASTPVLPASPNISLSQTSLAFSNVNIGVSSAVQSINVSNPQTVPTGNLGLLVTGADSASFQTSTTCLPAGLGVGANCTISVWFSPPTTSVAGSKAATLTVSYGSTGSKSVSLTGNAVSTAPTTQQVAQLSVSPTSLDLGTSTLDARSAVKEVRITSSGTGDLKVQTIAATGPFSVTNVSCPPAPFTLAPGSNCTVAVTYMPTQAAAEAGELSIATELSGTQKVALSGVGKATEEVTSGGCSISEGRSRFDPVLWVTGGAALLALGLRRRRKDDRSSPRASAVRPDKRQSSPRTRH